MTQGWRARRRVGLPILLLGLVVLAASGCNATKRELTVVFGAGTSNAQREAALHACAAAAPHASPEPVVTPVSGPAAIRAGVLITFRIDSANDRDLAHLEACLQKQPGVKGFQDSAA